MRDGRLVGIVSRRDLVRVIGRQDSDLQVAIQKRLTDAGVLSPHDEVEVRDGVATIRMRASARDRRLAESVALGVPGVLEVRFSLFEDT